MKRLRKCGIVMLIILLSLSTPLLALPKTAEESNTAMKDRWTIEESYYEYLGEFTITHYCGCRICNGKWYGYPAANGEPLQEGYTIAVDPNIIPLNSFVKIGDITYKACDTGSKIKGNRIDIFIADHNKCLELGIIRNVDVYLKK